MTRAAAPLAGVRIVVTRAARDAATLVSRLEALGAVPLVCPVIEFGAAPDPAQLDAALARTDADWVVFTSATGVRVARERVASAGIGPAVWATARVAAIGPATAAALHEHGIPVAFVPATFVAEALAETLPDVSGRTVLLIRAQDGRDVLRERLVARGAFVVDVAAYATRAAPLDSGMLDELGAGFDAITFASASAVDRFVARCDDALRARLAQSSIVTIGPVTSDAVRAHGLTVATEARSATMEGLVDALVSLSVAAR